MALGMPTEWSSHFFGRSHTLHDQMLAGWTSTHRMAPLQRDGVIIGGNLAPTSSMLLVFIFFSFLYLIVSFLFCSLSHCQSSLT